MYYLTEDQLAYQKAARDFVRQVIIPVAQEYDEKEEFPAEVMRQMWQAGLMNYGIPKEYGGAGLDSFSAALVTEEIGRGCGGFATNTNTNTLAFYPLLLGGTEEQKMKFIPPIITTGRYASFCLTEPDAGSDTSAISTTAKPVSGGYVIDGKKCFITLGDQADIYVVFATVDKSRGIRGLSAFVVPRGEGVKVIKREKKMGIRCSNTVTLQFEQVFVPQENLIGKEGQGFKLAMQTLDIARPAVGAQAVGVARAAFEESLKYAKERVQFGQSIAKFQMIQTMLAEMATKIDAARLLVWRAASLIAQKAPSYTRESAMAKLFATDTAMEATTNAVQILGGYGYCREYKVEKYMRDAKIMQIYEGTNQIQRLVIANHLTR